MSASPSAYFDPALLNLLLRLALSAVTLVSGIGKLRDLPGTRQAVGDFGVPASWVEPSALALAVVELGLAALLLPDFTCQAASLALLVLFLVFCGGIANLLRQDKAPPCHCFGAVHSAPVSYWTLFRTLGFAAMALVVAGTPRYLLTPGLKAQTAVALCFGALAVGVDKMVKARVARGAHNRPRKLQVGQRVPVVRLLDGRWLESVLPERGDALLILTSEGCGPCRVLEEPLAHWTEALQDKVSIIRIQSAKEPAADSNAFQGLLGEDDFRRFLSPTPGAILVDNQGTVLSPPVAGALEIEALLRSVLSVGRP